jgi:hypothetical protein
MYLPEKDTVYTSHFFEMSAELGEGEARRIAPAWELAVALTLTEEEEERRFTTLNGVGVAPNGLPFRVGEEEECCSTLQTEDALEEVIVISDENNENKMEKKRWSCACGRH